MLLSADTITNEQAVKELERVLNDIPKIYPRLNGKGIVSAWNLSVALSKAIEVLEEKDE